MDRLVPLILWLHMLIWGIEGPVPAQTWLVVLGGITTVFLSTVIVPPVSFQFTMGVVPAPDDNLISVFTC